jgi:branched-chain amino acid aminotransferase
MATERVAYFNGEIVPESQVKISLWDMGFLYGDAAFDVTRTFGGKIFKLREHLDRFYNSLKYMRLDPGMSKDQMADLTMQVLEANLPLRGENDDYWVSQRVTRGVPTTGEPTATAGGHVPTVVIACRTLPFKERAHIFRDGVQLVTPSVRRTPPESQSPRVKVQNHINLVLADLEVKAQNPDALPLMLDTNGNLSEGLGLNFFMVKDGVITTPREQFVLGGISRQTAIELAQELNFEMREADIDLFDAYTADEAFVTSTSWCICPVPSVNGTVLGDGGVPGPVTDRLQKAYSGLVGIDIVGQYMAWLD